MLPTAATHKKPTPFQFSLQTLVIVVLCIGAIFSWIRLEWDNSQQAWVNRALQMQLEKLRSEQGELNMAGSPTMIHVVEAHRNPPLNPRWQAYFPKATNVRLSVQSAAITKTGYTPSLEGGVTRHVNAGEVLTIEAHAMKLPNKSALVCLSINGVENVFEIKTAPPEGVTNWIDGKFKRSNGEYSEVVNANTTSIELLRLRAVEDTVPAPSRPDECTCPQVKEVAGPCPGLLIRLEPNRPGNAAPFVAPPLEEAAK